MVQHLRNTLQFSFCETCCSLVFGNLHTRTTRVECISVLPLKILYAIYVKCKNPNFKYDSTDFAIDSANSSYSCIEYQNVFDEALQQIIQLDWLSYPVFWLDPFLSNASECVFGKTIQWEGRAWINSKQGRINGTRDSQWEENSI